MRLATIVFYLLATFAKSSLSLPNLECNLIESKSPTLRLRKHLFCVYDTTVRPVTNKNTSINVTVSLTPKFMDYVSNFLMLMKI